MTLDQLRKADPNDMYTAIAEFPAQAAEGVEIGMQGPQIPRSRVRRVVVLGMGGSAIGGDLLRSYIAGLGANSVELIVNRGYVPPYIDRGTLVVASSYSGNTEETLSAYDQARKSAGAVLAITTGGKLARKALRNKHPLIILPSGLQPRAALGYSFFPLLYTLAVNSELFGAQVRAQTEQGIRETLELLPKLSRKYGAGPRKSNPAWTLAEKINGSVPVIYSAHERLDAVNLRWRGQIQENAKYLAFGNLLPEMNHNEITSWGHPHDLLKRFILIFLRDADDHKRIAARIDITRRILGKSVGSTARVTSQGNTLLARTFSLIHLGDWVSYYLAVINGTDPTPVPLIEDLKKKLAG